VYVGGRLTVRDGKLVHLDRERDIEIPLKAEAAAMTAQI
jgi:hypothetical protein